MPQTRCGFDDGPAGKGKDLLVGVGPTLLVDIGFDASFDVNNPIKTPQPGLVGVLALVDTGAIESCIDIALATSLGLPITDRRTLAGAGGLHTADVYLAQVHIPALKFTLYGAFTGVALSAGGQRHRALLGRTFLQNFRMIYDGVSGTVTISNEPPNVVGSISLLSAIAKALLPPKKP